VLWVCCGKQKLEGREGPFIGVPGHLVIWVCCGGPFSWLNERVARKLSATQCQLKLSLLKNKLKQAAPDAVVADNQVNWSSNIVTPYSAFFSFLY
jgi:hypothetical protein